MMVARRYRRTFSLSSPLSGWVVGGSVRPSLLLSVLSSPLSGGVVGGGWGGCDGFLMGDILPLRNVRAVFIISADT